MKNYTHKELVQIAYKWVLANASCGVAFRELSSNSSKEIPDVIGFGAWGHSVLIECKVSRSDFLSDKNKEFRKEPHKGMGSQRFYCCPTGLIKKDELPDGWGLLYVNDKNKCTCVHRLFHISRFDKGVEKNMLAEHGLLYSALRRLNIRGRIEEIYESLESYKNNELPL